MSTSVHHDPPAPDGHAMRTSSLTASQMTTTASTRRMYGDYSRLARNLSTPRPDSAGAPTASGRYRCHHRRRNFDVEVTFDDGKVCRFHLEELRRACPCAACRRDPRPWRGGMAHQ